jgi:hypothetical protein
VRGFYDPLLALLNRAAADGFIKASNRDIVFSHADVAALLDWLSTPMEVVEAKWIDSPGET